MWSINVLFSKFMAKCKLGWFFTSVQGVFIANSDSESVPDC